ncbi:MAG: cellulase family glycosylhydrolase [Candidatus Methanofastidiosia archaeon]|jgi:hypothetical protein
MKSRNIAVILVLIVLVTACIQQPDETVLETEHPESTPPETTPEPTPPETTPKTTPESPEPTPESESPQPFDKITLWDTSTGPHLRGANIYQRRVYFELDGPEYYGPGPVGPPFTQEDFDRLAALNCNYVNISHPGLFTEEPPYKLDKGIQDNLDNLLAMIEKADMFAVISFRTGPGRSEFTFMLEEVGDWFDESYLNDSVWQDKKAQDAWVTMWQYTAYRYKDNPIVAGYDLMVEPNSNETGSNFVHDRLDMWDPEEFYDEYGGTLYDWNQWYPEIIDAIREVDKNTPILVGGNGYSAVPWLPYSKIVRDSRIVYTAHQYAPSKYTHQWYTSRKCTYPGKCDVDWDGRKEEFDKAWLEDYLSPIDDFIARYNVPVAVNEFGVVRWTPGAAEFMDDQMGLFEERGINNALWEWEPLWEPQAAELNPFNFFYGADPKNYTKVDNALLQVIKKYWSYNTVRPSMCYSDTSRRKVLYLTPLIVNYLR